MTNTAINLNDIPIPVVERSDQRTREPALTDTPFPGSREPVIKLLGAFVGRQVEKKLREARER
ncbi:MAG: hypothetical protein WC455_11575 [Dehalococcoidia bacterium]|jgi:hypothetical protein